MMKLILLLLLLIKNVIGDCTTATKFTASVDPTTAFDGTTPTKIEVIFPTNIKADLAATFSGVDPQTGGANLWQVDGSIKMPKALGTLSAKFSYDKATTTIKVSISDGISSDAFINSQCSTTVLAAITTCSYMIGMNKQTTALTTLLGMSFWNQYVEAQTESCAIEGTIAVKYPVAYRVTTVNNDITKGNFVYSIAATNSPTLKPTTSTPTKVPTPPTSSPTSNPTMNPTKVPTHNPTKNPTKNPTLRPTKNPTKNPTRHPTKNPTKNPTRNPTKSPTIPYVAYINEFTHTGDAISDDSFEIVYHASLNLANIALSIYKPLNSTHIQLFSVDFPQSLTSVGWIQSPATYCNGNLRLVYKHFGVDVIGSGQYAMGLSYNGLPITDQFLGTISTRSASNGPFASKFPVVITINTIDGPTVDPPNGTSTGLHGVGNKYLSPLAFTVGGQLQTTWGYQNHDQTFCN